MTAEDGQGRLSDAGEEADLAKAFQAVAQGEQAAAQMERHLSALEGKIDELLRQATENQQAAESKVAEDAPKTISDGSPPRMSDAKEKPQ